MVPVTVMSSGMSVSLRLNWLAVPLKVALEKVALESWSIF